MFGAKSDFKKMGESDHFMSSTTDERMEHIDHA